MRRLSAAVLAALVVLSLLPGLAGAQGASPASSAEQVRAALVQAQLDLARNPAAAQAALDHARATFDVQLAPQLEAAQITPAFAQAQQALEAGSAAEFAAARAQIWTGMLAASYAKTEAALAQGDAATAQAWLPLREFRHATRFSRPDADATKAVVALARAEITPEQAVLALRADLLDTYQARQTEALHDLQIAEGQSFGSRRAEAVGLSVGYFAILAPAYAEQRGQPALTEAEQAFAALQRAATPEASTAAQAHIEQVLQGFRAAPLGAAEQERRAGQMLRFLSLVPVEYSRGVSGQNVTKDLEIREAVTFRDGAAAAFNDLRTLLDERDPALAKQAAQSFATLEQMLTNASQRTNVPAAGQVQQATDNLLATLGQVMPDAWQQRSSAGDFDVIDAMLDQMQAAVAAGQYDLAESARLEAYAILESGPEAKLVVFAPQMKAPIEQLFWFGDGDTKGLAGLIEATAPASEIAAARTALNAQLAEAKVAIGGQNAPVAVATNAAIIVFREGLEAVLILASLMGSLKSAEMRRYRTPMWVGAAAALGFSALTWLMSRSILNALLAFGINAEVLEVYVSLLAIGVLLLITNWFFHQVYWTGWMASFHQQKKRLTGGEASKWLGLALLGFSSIYREGFETVLFMQALVLESTTAVVLGGVAVGLLATLAIGIVVFFVQAKLPHKKMLIVTGIMICAVLVQMVGKTVHVTQVIGWLPTHPIRWLADLLPYWTGMWFGLYATWEGLLMQFASAAFVIGSYVLAERQKHKKIETAVAQPRGVPSKA
ncbi:MAG: FTR1 family protein [Roseiflexaceae bacterium]|nr:FTR1 family protein [Roseiflexaceae bacterium]